MQWARDGSQMRSIWERHQSNLLPVKRAGEHLFATPNSLKPPMLSDMFPTKTTILISLATSLLFLPACQSSYRPQGSNGTVGTYSFGRASVRIAEPLRIQTVIAAANATLRSRGYTIESTESTADEGKIIARQPEFKSFEKLVVAAALVPGAVEISITQQPFGDEERSRALMDAILQRLGL